MKLINPVKRKVSDTIVLSVGNCGCAPIQSQAEMFGGSWAQFYRS